MAERIIKVKVNVENNIVIDKTEEKKLCKILVSKGDKGQDGTVSFDELTEGQKAQLKGKDGVGVPVGGKAGQILAKTSDNDYETQWIDNNAEVDLTEYAKKEELPSKTSQLENDSNYLSSIPNEYITENELNEKGFLTEHQDLSEYAKKEYVDEKIANIDIGGVDLTEYAKKEELPSKTSQLENDSGFITNTDYASSDNVGLVKTESYYGLHTSSRNGTLYCEQFSYEEYTNEKDGNCFISKGTLENVLEGKDYSSKEYVDEKITIIPKPKKFDFPIGFIYMSVEETSPAEIFGGIWEQIKDTFLLACGDTYNNGDVGGEAEHTLIIDEIPAHSHNFTRSRLFFSEEAGQNAIGYGNNSGTAITATTQNSGGNKAHNNMPPYLTVYVWKKIGEDSITNSYAVASAWQNYNNGGADGTLTYNNLKLWMVNYDSTPDVIDGVSLDFEIEGSFNLVGTFNFYSYEGAPRNFGIYIFKDGNLYKELPQQFDTLGSAFDVSINELVETGSYEIVVGAYNNYEFGINSGTISFVEN